jgi:hypothetical protein
MAFTKDEAGIWPLTVFAMMQSLPAKAKSKKLSMPLA